jgi:hypothetical protein
VAYTAGDRNLDATQVRRLRGSDKAEDEAENNEQKRRKAQGRSRAMAGGTEQGADGVRDHHHGSQFLFKSTRNEYGVNGGKSSRLISGRISDVD